VIDFWHEPVLLVAGAAWYGLLSVLWQALFSNQPVQQSLARLFRELGFYLKLKSSLFEPIRQLDVEARRLELAQQNGKVVAATLVHADDEIMLITDKGILVRTRVAEIRELGRATQGVTLISLDPGSQLSGLQRIVENDAQAAADAQDGGDETAPGEGQDDAGNSAD
jgi:hypothetical protein